MKKQSYFARILSVAALLFFAFQNCGTPTGQSHSTSSQSVSSTAYCTSRGGTVVTISPAAGYSNTISTTEYDCSFDSGAGYINVDTLLNYHNGTSLTAVSKFLNWTQPNVGFSGNPADLYCIQIGGSTQAVYFNNGVDSNCVFADGSKIEAWTLFRGPSGAPTLFSVLLNR